MKRLMLFGASTFNAFAIPRFRAIGQLLLIIGLCLPMHLSQAGAMAGYVYTRALVTNENGNLTWGEYDPNTGKYLSDLAEATGDWDPAQWRVMSGDEYRSYESQYQALAEQYEDLEPPLSREEYDSQDFLLADGQTQASKPALRSGAAYVAMLPQSRRLIDDPQSLILAEFPVNPAELNDVGPGTLSLLVQYEGSGRGAVKAATANRIGFKAAFLKDKDGNPIPVPENSYEGEGFKLKRWEQSVLGPIPGAMVENPWFAKGVTDSEGFYSMQWYSIPCPLVGYSIDGYMNAWLRYQRFNPKARGNGGVYILRRPMVESCIPNVYFVPFFGPMPLGLGEVSTYPLNTHFPVDVTVLSGTAQLSDGISGQGDRLSLSSGKVPVAETTEFQAESPDNSLTSADGYDFDDDGSPDTIQTGYFDTDDEGNKIFALGTDGVPADQQLQGVWFSSGDKTPGEELPDLTRTMDSASFSEINHQGLLAQISAEDLRNTDIYVVRVADGKLIAERIGLNEYEADRIGDFGEDADNGQFFYTLQMRNSFGDTFRFTGGSFRAVGRDFDKWQSESGINPDLHQRQSDHLQPGDAIRLYAINRATGYIGHTDTVMQQAGSAGSGDLSFHIDPIIMGPPNLKVRVERDYKIQAGLEKGEIREDQIIGFEGASLTSDTAVKITTEWLDHEGRPVPEALEGAGYTGRIAILSGNKTLPNDNQGVYQFAIEPGEHLQVLQLPNNVASDSQHYYLHINGEPESGNPIFQGTDNERTREADFTSSGQNPGILEKRPNQFVPFLVPIYDEQTTELQRQAYRQIQRDDPDLAETLEKPQPIYRWVYRPEMQFSSYQLAMEEIRLSQDENGDGEIQDGESIDLLANEKPVITSGGILELIYNLTTTDLLPLDYFNAGENKELIFALGEHEIKATLGEDQTLQFQDLDQLASLDPDDLLTLRLYANNDMGNVLWEWAFGSMAVFPEMAEISADEHSIDFVALTSVGEGSGGSVTVRWEVLGDGGNFEESVTESKGGIFSNTLTTSTVTDSIYNVRLTVLDSDVDSVAVGATMTVGPYRVVSGVPASVELDVENPTLVTGVDSTAITATVRDQYQNLVSDGTPVSWGSDYSGALSDEQPITSNGMATATYWSGYEELSTSVSATAGSATGAFLIAKQAFDYSLTVSSSSISVDTAQTVTVQVTASVAPEEPVPVLWETTHGRIEGPAFLDGREVTAILYAGDVPGDGIVTANIAGVRQSIPINHIGNNPGTVRFDYAAIVGEQEGGSGTVETLNGNTNSYAYVTSTTATVYGTPGTEYTLSAGGFYTPNSEPLVHFGMNEIAENEAGERSVYDMRSGLNAAVDGEVSVSGEESYTMPGSSLLFEGGSLRLPYSANLSAETDIYVNLRFRAESAHGDQILIRKGTSSAAGLELRLVQESGDLYLQGSVETDEGTFTTVIDSVVMQDTWYIAGLRIRNGQLEIGLDQSRSQVAFTGTPLTGVFGSTLDIGRQFIGYIDEVKYGHDTPDRALILVEGGTNGTVTIGANGTATVNVSSSGLTVTGSTRVGFSGIFTSQTGQVETQELHIAQRMMSRLTGLPEIERSFAQTTQQINEHEDGLAVVNGNDFAQAAEMMVQAGSVVYDTVKSALAFLYEISGFSDIVTITRAIITWIDRGWSAVDKLELTFAGIGLTLSIVAVVTAPTGAGTVAALSAKTALRALRNILKELVTDPVTLLRAGGTVVRWTFDLLKKIFSGNPGQAVRQLADLGDTIIKTVSDTTGKTILMFAALVRSTKNLTRFLLLFRIAHNSCSVPALASGTLSYGPQYARLYDRTGLFVLGGLVGTEASAAQSSLCGQALVHAVDDAVALVRTSENRRVFNTIVGILDPLAETGKLGVNERTLQILARLTDRGYGVHIRELLETIEQGKLVTRAGENTTTIDDLMSAAVIRNKNTGDAISSADTAFDEFVKVLEELENIPDPREAAKLIGHLKPTKTAEQITAYQYKRVYGELRSLQIIKADPDYAQATLQTVDDTVIDGYFASRRGAQGVDSIWDIPGRGRLYVESKNWGEWARSASEKRKFLERLDTQFIKHVQETLIRDLRSTDVGWGWEAGRKPRLQYVNTGGFFKDDTAAAGIYSRFREIIATSNEDGFKRLRRALGHGTPEFDSNLADILRITDDPQLISPFVN